MKGLELCKKFYEELGAPMLQDQFSSVLPFLAVGLVGSGSECYGYDDEISRDHDFEPGFCIFIPDDDVIESRTVFQLERAYAKLPKEFMGFERNLISPVGGNRHGVITIGDFFEAKVGRRDGELSLSDWFSIPEYALAEAVNGCVFADHYGQFTEIREKLQYYPEDIRLKKLCGNLLLMGQAGQYNYSRCLSRNETAAAQLAAIEFVKSSVQVIFLLNKIYMPYYKWSFRALRELPKLSELAQPLEFLISSNNDPANAQEKEKMIESICTTVAEELSVQAAFQGAAAQMERLAYLVNDTINDHHIRNMHILSAV